MYEIIETTKEKLSDIELELNKAELQGWQVECPIGTGKKTGIVIWKDSRAIKRRQEVA